VASLKAKPFPLLKQTDYPNDFQPSTYIPPKFEQLNQLSGNQVAFSLVILQRQIEKTFSQAISSYPIRSTKRFISCRNSKLQGLQQQGYKENRRPGVANICN